MKLTRRSSLSLMAGAALAMPFVSRAHAQEEAVLNVYNWTDYIGETTIEDFQSATGIQVTYDLYDGSAFSTPRLTEVTADGDWTLTIRPNGPAATPEPGSVALLTGMCLSGAGFLSRRRKKARKPA